MRKTELKELYKMMFPDYPDIVTVAQLQQMLGVSRHLAYLRQSPDRYFFCGSVYRKHRFGN